MADDVEVKVTATRHYISDDLSLITVDGGSVGILQDMHGEEPGFIGIKPAELPALLARLQEAAAAMQIPTKQGEMARIQFLRQERNDALASLAAVSIERDAAVEALREALAEIEQLQQALASAKR